MADFCKFYQSEIALAGKKKTSGFFSKSHARETLTAVDDNFLSESQAPKNAKNIFLCLICFCKFPTYNVTEQIGSGASAIGLAPGQINNCQTIDWFCGKSKKGRVLNQIAYHNNNRADFVLGGRVNSAKSRVNLPCLADSARPSSESSLLIPEVF